MNFDKDEFRAGAHGLASGVFNALDGGSFGSGFFSGAAASGIGSFAQGVNMNSGLMVLSTSSMGGFAAWVTGGEFVAGALQGLQIGMFNHVMHGDNEGNTPQKVTVVTNETGTYEITVIGTYKKSAFEKSLAIANGSIVVMDAIGESLKKHSRNSYICNNGYYCFLNSQSPLPPAVVNSPIKAVMMKDIGKRITKGTGIIGTTLNGIEVYRGYKDDGSQIGYHTARATADVAGGWVGARAGAWLGAKAGFAIGCYFEGVGAVPGTIIGGAIGGIAGAYGGSWFGTETVDFIYGW